MNGPFARRKRWLTLILQLLVAALVICFVWQTLLTALANLGQRHWRLEFRWLVAAGVLNLLGFLPAALFWHRLLRVMGQDARLGESLRAYYVGQLGKYVPGKMMVLVIRAGMIRSHRVSATVAVAAVFVETLTMMAVGAFIAAAGLASLFPRQPLWALAGLGCMLLTALPTLPPVFKRLLRSVGLHRSHPTAVKEFDNVGFGTLLIGWALTAMGWAISGLGLWAVLRAMALPDSETWAHLPFLIVAVAGSKALGFVSMIPAGLGVSDLTLTGLLGRYFEGLALAAADTTALVAALALRIAGIVSEVLFSGLISGILYLNHAFRNHSRPQ